MPLLRALKDIPSTVSAITAGTQLNEPDEARAREWIEAGWAEPWHRDQGPASVNSRGWDGLMWEGATVAILASGPSLSIEQCDALHAWRDQAPERRKAIAINTTFRRAPWADLLYAADARWWKVHFDEAAMSFQRDQMWTTESTTLGIHVIPSRRLPGLSRQPGVIHQGANGGYQAIGLAWQAGASGAILVGFDMRSVNGKTHWHGDHPVGLRTATLPYAAWIKAFDELSPELQEDGFHVVNCTPRSALGCFDRMKLEDALR